MCCGRGAAVLVALGHGRHLSYTRQLGLLATGEQHTLAADAPSAPHSSFVASIYTKKRSTGPRAPLFLGGLRLGIFGIFGFVFKSGAKIITTPHVLAAQAIVSHTLLHGNPFAVQAMASACIPSGGSLHPVISSGAPHGVLI